MYKIPDVEQTRLYIYHHKMGPRQYEFFFDSSMSISEFEYANCDALYNIAQIQKGSEISNDAGSECEPTSEEQTSEAKYIYYNFMSNSNK